MIESTSNSKTEQQGQYVEDDKSMEQSKEKNEVAQTVPCIDNPEQQATPALQQHTSHFQFGSVKEDHEDREIGIVAGNQIGAVNLSNASLSVGSQLQQTGGSILDQLLPAKQNVHCLIILYLPEMDDKAGIKKLSGWDSLAKKSQSGNFSAQTSTQFELFRKHAREKEEKRKQLRVEEERRRRLKEQEEKERAKDQEAVENAELEQRRQNELLRQKEQERRRREAMSTGGDVTSQMDLMLNFEANF
ncbi:unnamed protein product [Thelazia callipaeda]|uniref:BRD4_CDT domain-containing protein n=1 Tax=Thelazia callipaeda TaxID=103827 RepID=A0A0N5CKK6_THECL|nr:unnamed protein product [Thelazia callipaeda]